MSAVQKVPTNSVHQIGAPHTYGTVVLLRVLGCKVPHLVGALITSSKARHAEICLQSKRGLVCDPP